MVSANDRIAIKFMLSAGHAHDAPQGRLLLETVGTQKSPRFTNATVNEKEEQCRWRRDIAVDGYNKPNGISSIKYGATSSNKNQGKVPAPHRGLFHALGRKDAR